MTYGFAADGIDAFIKIDPITMAVAINARSVPVLAEECGYELAEKAAEKAAENLPRVFL
jgi:hypothetical protein